MPIPYPYRVFRYEVEIPDFGRAGFSEVSGMNLSIDPIEYREGNDLRNTPRKYPGLTKFGNVTLKWGVAGEATFLDWLNDVAPTNQAGPAGMTRRDITISLLDDTGATGPQWVLINAWPVGYNVPDLSGLGGDIAIESLEICCEGMWRVDAGDDNGAAADGGVSQI